jgi:glutamate formiminotransferase
MSKIFSVIPNICEGRDEKFITSLTQKLKALKNLVILDVSMDKTRNRTVYAFTGTKEAIFEGGMILYEESIKQIDMRRHKGEYPRIGAIDVFPFVPLIGVTIEETIEISLEFANKVADEFKVPVYLFGESAKFILRKDVERIRSGEYEGLEEKLKDPRWKPDLGPDTFKPDFGATIIGARYPLVSFKMFLNTPELKIAKKICRSIQQRTGGLQNVTGYSGVVQESHLTQITVSISNHKETPLYKVIEMAKLEARRYGVEILEVEMIGLIPEIVFLESALYYMRINNFSYERLLERSIQSHMNEKVFLVT